MGRIDWSDPAIGAARIVFLVCVVAFGFAWAADHGWLQAAAAQEASDTPDRWTVKCWQGGKLVYENPEAIRVVTSGSGFRVYGDDRSIVGEVVAKFAHGCGATLNLRPDEER